LSLKTKAKLRRSHFSNVEESARQLFRAGVLQEVLNDAQSGGLFTEVRDDRARALDNLTGRAFGVELAQASPFTESHGFRNADQVDVDFVAQGLDQLRVVRLVAVLRQDADQRLAAFDRLARFTETTVETIGGEGLLEDNLERRHQIHRFVSGFNRNLRLFFNFLSFFAVELKQQKIRFGQYGFTRGLRLLISSVARERVAHALAQPPPLPSRARGPIATNVDITTRNLVCRQRKHYL